MQEVLSTRYWALEDAFLQRMSEIVTQKMEQGKDISAFFEGLKAQSDVSIESHHIDAFEKVSDSSGLIAYDLPSGQRVAKINMVGALSKGGGLCASGSIEMVQMIEAANASNSIEAIVLYVDGPGGTVSGTRRLGNAVKNSEKPVIAFVDEMAASAHYWVASQADYIMGNNDEYTQLGSIGVMSVMVNESKKLEKQGKKVLILRGDQSVDKNLLNSVEDWSADEIEKRQVILNEMNADFIDTVKEGRGERIVSDEGFTGKMYSLTEAIQLGLADYSGSLPEAFILAAEIAKSRKQTTVNI